MGLARFVVRADVRSVVYLFLREVVPLERTVGCFTCIEVFNGVAHCVEFHFVVGNDQQVFALTTQCDPTGIAMVAVFLRTNIGEVLIFRCALVLSDYVTGLTIPVVFQRATSEVFQLIHRSRQTETYADTGNNHLIAFAHFITSR